ncbi:protein JOKA2-like isoform X2 [Salvia hispanica]|uniref:protein JOKA2-like isoform X2 n=1 Tax=Salvia hispanica TaxID=49212 RepID=UPI002009BDA1|nr:protein JOKA2-like isoform X2 [Salvia hispanica]
MEDYVLIKFKYGNVVRRFNAPITDDKLFVSMDGLREKVLYLFSLAPGTDLRLTYLDEDNEVITLADDEDLCDIVKQDLDPVRVTVNVNNVTNANQTYQPRPNLITGNSRAAVGDAIKMMYPPTKMMYPKKDDVDLGLIRRVCGTYEGPISGTPLQNISAASPHSASDANPFRGSRGQDDSSGSYCHWGVGCDGCGIVPIVGPRFKSKVKLDYDLCLDCHSKIGNGNDCVRIERPTIAQHHLPYLRARDRGAIPRVLRGSKVEPNVEKLDSRFIQDVNIFDGCVMEPLTPFTKIWRMRNSGTLAWPKKTKLVWIGGDQLTNAESIEVPIPDAGLLVDQELDVSIRFISPKHSGRYISYWRLASPSGEKFGQRVWVIIQVEAPAIEEESPRETLRDLNLNLPPPPPPIYKLPPPPPPPPPPRRTPFASIPESIELHKKSLMEDKLLGELKEMGFDQVDRNKQLLRMNGYDLDQAVDDLCGVSEWDPILEELEEMK